MNLEPLAIDIRQGDCLELMRLLDENSVDSIVTDPPYGLSFMGKKWDYDVPSVEIWAECLRVLKPGGHLLAFAGTRTQHRMAVRIEDAGFEIRDMIAWVYGSGFPKSLNVGKAVDKLQGNEREVEGYQEREERSAGIMGNKVQITRELTKGTSEYEGWGTALKPALEPITMARKPLIGTVAANVLAHGTGGINVDGCRVAWEVPGTVQGQSARAGEVYGADHRDQRVFEPHAAGRWPANLIHDGSDEVVELLDTAARFFYCAKASKRDRDEGCEGLEFRDRKAYSGAVTSDPRMTHEQQRLPSRNHHPTVKPTELMRYLCRLVTPPGGIVLDPFMGSGSTGKAAILEKLRFIGFEISTDYIAIARARIAHANET